MNELEFYEDKDISMPYSKFDMLVRIDRENLDIYAYDYIDELIDINSEGILREAHPELFRAIESYFDISLKEYGVTLHTQEDLVLEIA